LKACTEIDDYIYFDCDGLWKRELADFVPDVFIDAHGHIGLKDAVGPLSYEKSISALATFTHMKWETLRRMHEEMFPGKRIIRTCCFGFVINEVDIRKANSYVIKKAFENREIMPLLLASPKDPEAIEAGMAEANKLGVKIYGLKPYYEFASDKAIVSPLSIKLDDFVTEEMLEFCNKNEMILMLHTCSIGMGDNALADRIEQVLTQYPKMRLILAHMGRFYKKEQFYDFMDSDFIERNADRQFWFDISSVTDKDVFIRALQEKRLHKKLLYAQDMPFGSITGVEIYSKTHGGIFLTRDDYVWSDEEIQNEFSEERKTLTYNNYHCIRAFKEALETAVADHNERNRIKNDVFLNNAKTLFRITE